MTVCIAAITNVSTEEAKIVFCTDWRGGNVVGSADTFFKIRRIHKKWIFLPSGHESDVNSIEKILIRNFNKLGATDAENIDATIRSSLHERKRQKVDDYIQGRFAISYDEFLKLGKEKFAADVFRDAQGEIDKISLRVELIIAGFIDGEPELYKTDGSRACPLQDFAVVGEGEYLATASLYQRSVMNTTPFDRSIFSIYEAKKWAEGVASVGSATALGYMEKNGDLHFTSELSLEKIEKYYDKYGVRQRPPENVLKEFSQLVCRSDADDSADDEKAKS